jgi:hypothetical protein
MPTIPTIPTMRTRTAHHASVADHASLADRPAGAHADLDTPMELLGVHPGISIIDPSTVLTRLWYFDGKFLRAEGFRRDQEYVRSLVALSNQAVGSGLVHGFDVRLGGSDRLRIEAGLGLAPSGRVVYLPADTQLSIAQLISRSAGGADPSSPHDPGTADFSRCPPDAALDPELPVPPRPLYVLTVAAAEALCGEEERFGKLCEDACATDTDRSVAVEGVRFRVRELVLTLPTSRTVAFTGRHLRSRVASAFFREERRAVPSMISGAGLRSEVWCAGADGIGGEEIWLAVFDRAGMVTSFVDQWTARRELVETSPHRYWQWRLAARPLDVFLAQVLQFQCQLVGIAVDSGPDDNEERRALEEVGAVLGALPIGATTVARRRNAVSNSTVRTTVDDAALDSLPSALVARLGELHTLVAGALAGNRPSPTGSLLIDHGIVETASAGYLPVDPGGDVRTQVHAYMGPGVDLRFCAVRADFIPEAFQEAQHMERISLTQGMDDPDRREEVDVLVPGATFGPRQVVNDALVGRVRVMPGVVPTGETDVDGSEASGAALTLSAVARDQVTDGWSWTLAAFGEASRRLGVTDLAGAVLSDLGRPPTGLAADGTVRLHVDDDASRTAALRDAGMLLRLNREGSNARARRERIDSAIADRPGRPDRDVTADLAVDPNDRRPAAGWFDAETTAALDSLPVGGRTPIRLRGTFYSRASTSPVFFDVQVQGTAIVTSRQVIGDGSGAGSTTVFTTRIEGVVDPLVVIGGEVVDEDPAPIRDLVLEWRVVVEASRTRIVSVTAAQGRGSLLVGRFSDSGTSPRHIEGFVGITRSSPSRFDLGSFAAVTDTVGGVETRRLGDLELDGSPGALDVGSPGRDLGASVIDVIGAELAARQRENGFGEFARARLFPPPPDTTGHINAHADWVMFHRRRTKQCTDADQPTPVVVRRLRWYHATRSAGDDNGRLAAFAGSWQAVEAGGEKAFAKVWARLDAFGFETVDVVEFLADGTDLHSSRGALRTAWSNAPRGSQMPAAIIATAGPGDGAVLNLGRLHAATGAVGDLIDLSRLTTRVLTEIPPDVQSAGVDGVILSIGIEPTPVETVCAHVFRMSTTAFGRLMSQISELRSLAEIRQFLDQFNAPAAVIATFAEDVITNVDEVQQWWPGTQVEVVALAFDRSIVGDAALVARWSEPRTAALREILPIVNLRTPDNVEVDLDGCQAVYFVADLSLG